MPVSAGSSEGAGTRGMLRFATWERIGLVVLGIVVAALLYLSTRLFFSSNAPPVPAAQPVQTSVLAKPQFPHMQLQAQYAGPLGDTIIQRWRDPIDGTVCYLYLPIAVHHSPPTRSGFVEYGSNNLGSITCMPGNALPKAAQ